MPDEYIIELNDPMPLHRFLSSLNGISQQIQIIFDKNVIFTIRCASSLFMLRLSQSMFTINSQISEPIVCYVPFQYALKISQIHRMSNAKSKLKIHLQKIDGEISIKINKSKKIISEKGCNFNICKNCKWSDFCILSRTGDAGYLFSWDKIPENDGDCLIKFLTQKFDIDWVKAAEIEKIDDGRTIRVYNEKNSLSLRLDDEKIKVNLEIDGVKTDEFIAIMEDGNLNIYDTGLLTAEIQFRFPVYVRALASRLQATNSEWIFFLFEYDVFRFIAYGEKEWFQGIYLKDRKAREKPLDLFYKTGNFKCYAPAGGFYSLDFLSRFLYLAEDRSMCDIWWDNKSRMVSIISIGNNPMYNEKNWKYRYYMVLEPKWDMFEGFEHLSNLPFTIVPGMTIGECGLHPKEELYIEPFRSLLRIALFPKASVGGPGFAHPESGCLVDLEHAYRLEKEKINATRTKK